MRNEHQTENETSRPPWLRLLRAALDAFYKLGFLAAMVWIGFGLQSIAAAIDANTDTCSVEPDAGDDAQPDEQSGMPRPQMSHIL